MNLWVYICDVNNESDTNVVRRINTCKKFFLLALVHVHSIVLDIIFGISSTILVMVPAEVVYFGG